MENFKWTPELVKEFGRYTKNYQSSRDNDKAYDDFVASHSLGVQNEKEWEIQSYITDNFGVANEVFRRTHDDYFKAKDFQPYSTNIPEEILIHNKATIHSVLRKSDGVVFTVGDEIDMDECGFKKIDAFLVSGKGEKSGHSNKDLWISTNKDKGYGTLIEYAIKLQPLPKRTKLFATEDGVDIFDGEKAWWVNREWRIGDGTFRDGELRPNYKHFSTEEKAKEYILLNKPCLSVNDVISKSWLQESGAILQQRGFYTEELKRAAKSKLH